MSNRSEIQRRWYKRNKHKLKIKSFKSGKHNPLPIERLKELTYIENDLLINKSANKKLNNNINTYKYMVLDNQRYTVADLTIYYITGKFPKYPNVVDHINGVRGDNRISNLRVVTRSENNLNRKVHRGNKMVGLYRYPKHSEIKKKKDMESLLIKYADNVYYDNDKKRWAFEKTINGVRYRKRFKTEEEAIEYGKSIKSNINRLHLL